MTYKWKFYLSVLLSFLLSFGLLPNYLIVQTQTTQTINYKFNFGENIETLEQKIQVACSHFGCSAKRLIYLAKCESTNNPLAINYREPGQPSGLFQHKIIYWPERAIKYGIPGASVFDQDAQIWVTAQMFPKYSYLWAC